MGGGSEQQAADQSTSTSSQQQNPCHYELQQFVQCAQNQREMSYCQGFNEVLKQCKIDHGMCKSKSPTFNILFVWLSGRAYIAST
jgi:hypothetical protein